jgi:hypothetical protein
VTIETHSQAPSTSRQPGHWLCWLCTSSVIAVIL